MASNLTVDTLTKGATTLNTDELVDVNDTRVAKAWVNFNGTGTVAIRSSFNVASITDNGTGDYTVNFTTAMDDANYTLLGTAAHGVSTYSANRTLGIWDNNGASNPSTTACRIATIYGNESRQDCVWVNAAFFR